MRHLRILTLLLLACLFGLAACDSDEPTTVYEGLPSALPGLTQAPTAIIRDATPTLVVPPSATLAPRLKVGDAATALEALRQLRVDALGWRRDALFIMLVNVAPGQESRVLGVALSDPDLTDPTEGGVGTNWVLLTVSRSANSVVVLNLNGEKTDLVASGKVPASLLAQLTGTEIAGVEMRNMDLQKMKDSPSIPASADGKDPLRGVSQVLLSPAQLGLARLFEGNNGRTVPDLMYEVFSSEASSKALFYDALTGEQVLQVKHE